jgi:hypothetical protein
MFRRSTAQSEERRSAKEPVRDGGPRLHLVARIAVPRPHQVDMIKRTPYSTSTVAEP